VPSNRIAELRREQSLTQAGLAERLGIDPATVSRWERGLTTIPDWRKVELAEMFGVSVPWLMGWGNDK